MRPSSRGVGIPGTASGAPPGTGGIRPGSGRNRPPGTARLRTGVASSGPVTQAAQGIALQTSVNVSDRPVTGQGMMGMRQSNPNAGRLVEDAAFYVGILRKRVTDISTEMNKLRNEIDNNSKESSQYSQLERKYETLIKSKEALEGQLADYNLALDKVMSTLQLKVS
jgi:intraflagellar transport protein 74